MLSLEVLSWALEAVGIAVVLGFLSLIALRVRMDARTRQVDDAVKAVEPLLHAWLVSGTDLPRVRDVLRGMPPHAAFRGLARLTTHQLTLEHQQALARALRDEPWVERILRAARSRLWWRRFDVARLLCVVGDDRDAALIASLMRDPNAAVRLVAIDAAARLPGRLLIDEELESLPSRQDAVRAYQISALAYHPRQVGDALLTRLTPDTPVPRLIAWIDTAGSLNIPEVLERVRELASHPEPEVRVHVATALRRHAHPETPRALLSLLSDPDWRVRAQSARSLGALRCGSAIDRLALAAQDPAWWVRFRSTLALAQIGGQAGEVLNRLTRSEDRMARDISILVAGLSSAAVVEMAEM